MLRSSTIVAVCIGALPLLVILVVVLLVLTRALARLPVPNVDVTFPKNDHTIVMRTNQDVRENEQLTIAYVDTDADVEERAARLAMYGFRCECEKCREER